MAGRVIEEASIVLSLPSATLDEQGYLAEPGLSREIRDAMTTFARAIEASGERPLPCA